MNTGRIRVIIGVGIAASVIAGLFVNNYYEVLAQDRDWCQDAWFAHNYRERCEYAGIDVDNLPGMKEVLAEESARFNQDIENLKKERTAFIELCVSNPDYYAENFKKCFDAKEFGWYSNGKAGIFVK